MFFFGYDLPPRPPFGIKPVTDETSFLLFSAESPAQQDLTYK